MSEIRIPTKEEAYANGMSWGLNRSERDEWYIAGYRDALRAVLRRIDRSRNRIRLCRMKKMKSLMAFGGACCDVVVELEFALRDADELCQRDYDDETSDYEDRC